MIITVTFNPVLDRTLTVAEIRTNDVLRATQTRLDWGGKGINVSRVLKTLGQDSIASGFLGGETGHMLQRGLQKTGIPVDFFPISGDTRTNVVIMEEADPAAGQDTRHIKVNEAGPQVSLEEQEAFLEYAAEYAFPGDIWTFCGSLPPGVAADYPGRLIKTVQGRGARAVLDSSGEALRLGCAAAPYLIKPNREEAAAVLGMEVTSVGDAELAARRFLEMGVQIVALSMGSEGLLLCSRDGCIRVRPPAVKERNPTGAGDSLLAGLLLALSQGYAPERAAWLGVACGAASVIDEGVGQVSPADVSRFYAGFDPDRPLPVLPGYLMTSEIGSFARATIVERKPTIIRQVMEDNAYPVEVQAALHAFTEEIASLPLLQLKEDTEDTLFWNRNWLIHQGKTWLDIPWYFAETYFYRRLLECVRYLQPGVWQGVDPFGKQKERQIREDVNRLAGIWLQFDGLDDEARFEALLHSCLWGNRTDLSNFTIQMKAAQGLAARQESANIIIDHTAILHARLQRGAQRVDFINDNAGSDTLFDLALADFLLRRERVNQVVFHIKDRPFFVSDAMPKDIRTSVDMLRASEDDGSRALGVRLDEDLRSGRLSLKTHPFWTSCRMFREFPPEISADLKQADFVILKGDVNYRRVFDDRHWPHDTMLEEAAAYFPAPFVLMRTLKGEIMLGLAPGEAKKIQEDDPDWLINGKRGVIHSYKIQ